jgi:signal transduction histidine kinase
LAEQPCSANAGAGLADAVDQLPWLCPGVAALRGLAQSPRPAVWCFLRHDPGAVILLLRQPGASVTERLYSPGLFEQITHYLDADNHAFVDWNADGARSILQTGVACASLAATLGRRVPGVDPDAAWTCGLLAPLGWYAACALDRNAVAACLRDPDLAKDALATQRRHWGIDAAGLARRVARRWRLPAWLTAVAGRLALPPQTASEFGADTALFRLTRLAVGLARERGVDLGLPTGDPAEDLAALGLLPEDVNRLETPLAIPADVWRDPRQEPLLRDLLAVAAENRRLREGRLRRTIEAEADGLHDALARQAGQAEEQLRASKLAAMAEFAAGAGHEINNPLAVISGQAQYVLAHAGQWFSPEAGDAPRQSLQAVITHTKRIHNLLRDLMQFARPSPPRPDWFDLSEVLGETAAALRDLAEQRHVALEVQPGPGKVAVRADREQVKTALGHLLRNAVEAAPTGGWARAVLQAPAGGRVALAIEDSGPGPDESKRDHLFDPFYSGRCAGRGRGLGLPTAWRLVRLQGGDVRLDPPRADAPTRFVLELPWSAKTEPEPTPTVFTETVGLSGVAVNGCHRVKG